MKEQLLKMADDLTDLAGELEARSNNLELQLGVHSGGVEQRLDTAPRPLSRTRHVLNLQTSFLAAMADSGEVPMSWYLQGLLDAWNAEKPMPPGEYGSDYLAGYRTGGPDVSGQTHLVDVTPTFEAEVFLELELTKRELGQAREERDRYQGQLASALDERNQLRAQQDELHRRIDSLRLDQAIAASLMPLCKRLMDQVAELDEVMGYPKRW